MSHWKQGNHEELLDKFTYEYDIGGNKTKVIKERKDFPEDTGTFAYSYDSLNRLHEVAKDGSILRTYHYDGYGNRTTLQASENTTGYTYNSLNQLVSSVDNQEGQTYSYDKRGNLTEIFKNQQLTHQYHFGALNRLESVYNYEKQLGATYQYNGLGHRVSKTEGQPVEQVLSTTDLSQLHLNPTKQLDDVLDLTRQFYNLFQRNEDCSATEFVYDSGVLSVISQGETLRYLNDDLGSPMRIISEHGDVQNIFDCDEFGNSLHAEHSYQPFGFTGHQFDEVAGNYFAQARQYSPEQGRFISEDRIKGFVQYPFTLSSYTYCWNQPLDLVDLNGLCPICPPLPPDVAGPPKPSCFVGPLTTLEWYLSNSGHTFNDSGSNDAIQVSINNNTITLDVHIDIQSGGNLQVGGTNASNLVVQGIEQWSGNHTAFGYNVTIDVNVHQRGGWRPFSRQNHIPVNIHEYSPLLWQLAGQTWGAVPHFAHAFNSDNPNAYGLYGHAAWNTTMPGGIQLYIRDQFKDDYLPALIFMYIVAHEFGHAFGIGDAWCGRCDDLVTSLVALYDIMARGWSGGYGDMDISSATIEKLILAMVTGEWQSFGDICPID